MQIKRIYRRLFLIGAMITLLGLWGGWDLVTKNDPTSMELTNAYISSNLVSLYLQPTVFTLLFSQVLTFRRIYPFVDIRQKTNHMITNLFILATIYCLLFCLSLIIPYLFTNYPFFKNGNPLLGSIILLLHVGVLLFLAWVLVGAYQLRHPYFLLFIVIILNLVYHYYVEPKLLIMYSPLYDPVYRAIHHIYGGY